MPLPSHQPSPNMILFTILGRVVVGAVVVGLVFVGGRMVAAAIHETARQINA